jgi:hypothetical protein
MIPQADPAAGSLFHSAKMNRAGCGIAVLCLILLVILIWVFRYNQQASAKLDLTKKRIAAARIVLDPIQVIPSPPPGEENFWATPFLVDAAQGDAAGPRVAAIRTTARWVVNLPELVDDPGVHLKHPGDPGPTDWTAFREALRRKQSMFRLNSPFSATSHEPARDLWNLLEHDHGSVFAELSAALQRPQTRFVPGVLQRPFTEVPASGESVGALIAVYHLRCRLANALEDWPAAVDSCHVLLRLAQGFEYEGFDFHARHGPYRQRNAVQAIWALAADRRMSGESWKRLGATLRTITPLDSLTPALKREFFFASAMMNQIRKDPGSIYAVWPRYRGEKLRRFGALPRGFYDASEALTFDGLSALLYRTEHGPLPDRYDSGAWAWSWNGGSSAYFSDTPSPQALATGYLVSGIADSIRLFAAAEAATRMAEAACALEEYFIDNQAYPQALEALIPSYLTHVPRDIDVQPIRYRLEPANQRYSLWSVATNGLDEGGVSITRDGRPERVPWTEREGDWGWNYPD